MSTTEPYDVGAPVADGAPAADEWRIHGKSGRRFVPRKGRSGLLYQQGDETVADARRRDDALAADKADSSDRPAPAAPAGDRELPPREPPAAKSSARPKPRHPKRPPMPDAPRKVDLKELEATFAEAFKSPAIICATFGDEWAAEHFQKSGPYLARNLITAAQHNPWLLAKLETAATGQDAMMMVVTLVGVGGAAVAYLLPPIIWWTNLPVPDKTRQMFGIPPRKEPPQTPAYAADQNGAAAPPVAPAGTGAPPPGAAL